MMKSNFISIALVFCLILSCGKRIEVFEITYDKSIIPEGITINPKTGKLYLSSVHKKKIIEIDLKSDTAKDFTQEGDYGYQAGVGMLVKDNKLFALSGDNIDGKSPSVLVVLDLDDGTLIQSYTFKDTTKHFMNDLAMANNNDIYITDTEGHRVLKLNYPEGEIETFFTHDDLKYPNGIAISDEGDKLFVDSYTGGIRIIDLATKSILNPKHEATTEIAIDGLKYYKGDLYAIRNGGEAEKHGLIKIALNAEENMIESVDYLLKAHEKMDLPTTFCIQQRHIYILANSQLDNLDQQTNQIIKADQLTNTYVIKYRIE